MEEEFELELFDLDNDIEMEEDELQQELKLLEMEQSMRNTLSKSEISHNKEKLKKKEAVFENNVTDKNEEKKTISTECLSKVTCRGSNSNSKARPVSKQNRSVNKEVNFKKLFKPLHLDKGSLFSIAGRELAHRLEENKAGLLGHVFRVLGAPLTMEIFEETKKIMKRGGLKTDSGDRRRSPGGTFLYLMKSRGYATKSQLKEIFKEEEAIKKQFLKEKYKRVCAIKKDEVEVAQCLKNS